MVVDKAGYGVSLYITAGLIFQQLKSFMHNDCFLFRSQIAWSTDIQQLSGLEIDVEVIAPSTTARIVTSLSHNFVSLLFLLFIAMYVLRSLDTLRCFR